MLAADTALYAAKERGRDRVTVYEPATAEVAARHVRASWTQRLRETLDAGQLVPYQQPILDTQLGLITQCELLVRVLDEVGKPIPPAAFLVTAERTGMVVEIDRFMIQCAIDLISASSGVARPGGPLAYAVNLSARSLAQPDLPADVVRRIEAASIDPKLLTFEITETVAITDMEAAKAFAHPLRALGCAFALDDFGAGFASFHHLKHLPVDWLKIDGDYIRDLPRSRTDQVIVQHMARIGQELGLRTTAEFVGDRETLAMVAGYGVHAAQGFHIGRPEPVSAGAPSPHPSPASVIHDQP
jgi:EAL domain-containing protein (putative c-di-GMP-specific phosphodiesterase class I)